MQPNAEQPESIRVLHLNFPSRIFILFILFDSYTGSSFTAMQIF